MSGTSSDISVPTLYAITDLTTTSVSSVEEPRIASGVNSGADVVAGAWDGEACLAVSRATAGATLNAPLAATLVSALSSVS